MNTVNLRPNVLAARARLAEGREKLRQRHARGSPGIQVCETLTDLVDAQVLGLFDDALAQVDRNGACQLEHQVALVAHSGFGRRDMAPHSDVDLMLLHAPEAASAVVPLAERLVRDLFDAGMVLGQSVRTINQACQLARKDATIFTSLVESRHLAGSTDLFERFQNRFSQVTRRSSRALSHAIEAARQEERQQFGETVYLLEPNVKRTAGGLRDIQLVRWAGYIACGASDLESLKLRGVLTPADFSVVRQALDMLLRLRNELHFHSGKANDVLDRSEQLRLAAWLGYQGKDGLLPVEEFMREYFRLTTAVCDLASRSLNALHPPPRWLKFWEPLFSHQFERDFRVGPNSISANSQGLAKLRGNLAEILRLTDLANLYDKPIAAATQEAVRSSAGGISAYLSPESQARFLSLLSQPARLGALLRDLHRLGVLEKVIPAFAHAKSLLQFNEYHKYTVDEHCLRAVDEAVHFRYDAGTLGWVYRGLKRKWLLHLALLLHDLGKGHIEDHCEVGLTIALDMADRLGLSDEDTQTLCFLVHKHLMMSHLAFRRDTSDHRVVVRFAVDVGSPEALQMLFVLTAADLAAVGPGVLNAWKVEVLADLYHRAMQELAGETSSLSTRDRTSEARAAVLDYVRPTDEDRPWFERQLAALPASILLYSRAEQVAADLMKLHDLTPGDCYAQGHYLAESNTVEYTVGTNEQITPGIFHKLTGALTGRGLQILSAQIHTLADGLVFDRFNVQDPDYAGRPPPNRIDEVCQALCAALTRADSKLPVFRRLWRASESRRAANMPTLPTQVRFDNSTSDRFTIIDVFTSDRMGLLYTIARTIFGCGLSVSVAKIGTYLDQVVDVFYVTDEPGRKVLDESRLKEIRERLLEEIDALARQDVEQTAGRAV